MKGKVYAIISIIVLIVSIIGCTFAYVYYRSDVTGVNLTFDSNLGSYINYKSGDYILGDDGAVLSSSNDYTGGLSTEIEFWKTENAHNMDIYGHIYMDIDTGSDSLLNEKALKWAVVSNDKLISEGNFSGYSQGDSIPMLVNQKLLSIQTKFKIYIWLDDFSVSSGSITGEGLTVTIRCEATSGEYEDFNVSEYTFDYTGGVQTLSISKNGTYKLEVWGAQGGSSSSNSLAYGGYGGYSVGEINLTAGQTLYIYVGGEGTDGNNTNTTKIGGYNGGGDKVTPDNAYYSSSGGGATHIAFTLGLLSTLSGSIDDILIVAGGGGGGAGISGNYGVGGSGGGYVGSSGTNIKNNIGWGAGGTQLTGGCKTNLTASGYCGSFGLGNSTSKGHGGAGGGGFYGGGSTNGDNIGGGGGGSGYIGNSLLTNKVMYCYNCKDSSSEADETNIKTISTIDVNEEAISNYAKIGNGYAKITGMGEAPITRVFSRKTINYGRDYDFKVNIVNELDEGYIVTYSTYDNASILNRGEYQIRYIIEDESGNEYFYYQKVEIV